MFFKPYEGSVKIKPGDGAAVMERALTILIMAGIKIEGVTPTSIRFAQSSKFSFTTNQRLMVIGSGTFELIGSDTLRMESRFQPGIVGCIAPIFILLWFTVAYAGTIGGAISIIRAWDAQSTASDYLQLLLPLFFMFVLLPAIAYFMRRTFLQMKESVTSGLLRDLAQPVFKSQP